MAAPGRRWGGKIPRLVAETLTHQSTTGRPDSRDHGVSPSSRVLISGPSGSDDGLLSFPSSQLIATAWRAADEPRCDLRAVTAPSDAIWCRA